MIEYKIILGILAVMTGIFAYIAYFRNIFSGRTKPHAFSWLVWGILTAIAFFAQISGGAGPGAWVTGTTILICLAIFFVALFKGEKDFPFADWLCLAGAAAALLAWFLTKNPTLSVILIVITDALAFIPTYRKGFFKPYEETATSFALNGLKFVFAIPALNSINIITALYPAYLILANWIFVGMLLFRRNAIKYNEHKS